MRPELDKVDSTLLKLFNSKFERGGKTPGTHDCQTLFVEVMKHYGHNVVPVDIGKMAIEQVVAMQARGEYPYSYVDEKIIKQEISTNKWQK